VWPYALLFVIYALSVLAHPSEAATPLASDLSAASFSANDLAVLVNDTDPLSVAIGDYYRRKRGIPPGNMIHVQVDANQTTMSAQDFSALRAEVMIRTPAHVQAYALTWVKPYRVECMSITTAVAAGFNRAFCSEGCKATRWSPYFNSNSRRPFDDFGWRPTMSIAALDFKHARQLIDRGAAAGQGALLGRAYLLQTDDVHRNVRAATYADAKRMVGSTIDVEIVSAPALREKPDVMFYFIGAARVDDLDTNRFLPGALADHLTSSGGDLTGSSQMSSLRWLEAGATGSYGTVVEPCNLRGKFPNVGILMRRYLDGETLLEAYWKSVAMPGQGLFIGDPLARPYGAHVVGPVVSSW
jgi:uncharacterized protein (TIGR03790 family)